MFDFLTESGVDEAVLDKSLVLDDALSLYLEELDLLDQIHVVLVELSISMDVSKESPVIEVVDGILENGIAGAVTPEATMEPGGEGFQWFVRCIVGGGI